jgi:putative N6-adenine-specific DNA methylase
MTKYDLMATSTFGLESIVAQELKELGYNDLKTENGRVSFSGEEKDIAITNTWLRTADRIVIKIAEFRADNFDQLFDKTAEVNWSEFLPENAKMHVNGKSIKSKLFSVPDCQAIVKKAIIENMKKKYKKSWFSEDGPVYKIEIGLLKDIATLTIDTTGPSLHKRGYREDAGEAPIKETLAAALVILSKWEPSRVLADPFCGSGTIPIEAAMIARNIAPGLKRNFTAEDWNWIPAKVWKTVREEAKAKIKDLDFRILASDIDGWVLKKARENAKNAGVEDNIAFQKLAMEEFASRKKYGCMISNPPYGERIGPSQKIKDLYIQMGKLYTELESWSFFTLTANEEFEKLFGTMANKNRKLYNGNIKCYYYQHFGPLPVNL